MWVFESAGRANEVRVELELIDPATLDTAVDRAMRACLLTTMVALPPDAGVLVRGVSDGSHLTLSIRRVRFGTYAT